MRLWMTRETAHGRQSTQGDHSHEKGKPGEREQGVVKLSPETLKINGIEVAEAGPGTLERTITLPGEVHLDADRVAHIVPRVSGMVREVLKKLGEPVKPGEVIAILDSRELADAKAADLAAASRHELAKANLERIQKLFEKKIAPEEELLKARQALAETDIDHRTAEAKLHALGLTEQQVESLHSEKDTDYSRYEIKAPFSGTVIEKHITLGEVVNPDTTCFVLADLSNVWIDVTVYGQDIIHVHVGQTAHVKAEGIDGDTTGKLFYVSSVIDEATRTATARLVLDNVEGRWKPGLFVRATVSVASQAVAILLPLGAVQTVEGQPTVYVEKSGAFEPRKVTVGDKNATHIEITSGLKPGERVVVKNAFIVKSQGMKSELGEE
ncbi:MAG: efflux RND transporter periplasmic adaptor subunit [Planctomycetia bacterium]|nr:MAG: efflux RND transporter periplasmic adaptor subunit [Planctomycetia bacterium]